MSKFGKGASFFRVRQGLQSLNPALTGKWSAFDWNLKAISCFLLNY